MVSLSSSPHRVVPLEKFVEGRASVAIAGFFFGGQFCESLLNLRKVKKRVVTETVCPARSVENDSFRFPVKRGESLAIASSRQHTDKSSAAFLRWQALQFAQHARIVRIVIRVCPGFVRLLIQQVGSCIAGGMHTGGSVQRINLESGIVGDDEFSRDVAAAGFRLLPGVFFEGETVLDHSGQGREVGDRGDLDSMRRGGAGKIAQLAWA